jgi:hypothetical protein
VTQDRDDTYGYFGITAHRPIPVLQYGDSFTWAKCSYMVLHPDMIPILKPGQDTSYCNTLMSFLQADVKGFVSFQPYESLHDDIDNIINNLVHGETTATQQISFFDPMLSITIKDSNEIFSFLEGKARETTIVPFLVFLNLFHQKFTWHIFLESTLEILQQFYIAIEKCDEQYHIFPRDQYQYFVKCMRCHKCVSSTTLGIGDTLLKAPSAMLRNWNILWTHDADWEVPLTSFPLLFTSTESYKASKTSFENLLDTMDNVLHYPYFCTDKHFGQYNFCEAVKVDLLIQHSTQTKEQNYERYVSNSMTLVQVLFEELHPAIDYIKDLGCQTMKAKLDQHFTLLNSEKMEQ